MEIERWKQLLKEAKRTQKDTGQYSKDKTLTIYRGTHAEFAIIKECSHCGHKTEETFDIYFKEPPQMTIFEAGLLYALFFKKQIPVDYASYHTCVSGQKFIENIDQVNI